MNSITVITYGYPSTAFPTESTFVMELVEQWRKLGIKVQVVNPMPYWRQRGKKVSGFGKDDCFPKYHDYRLLKIFPFLRCVQDYLAENSFKNAVEKHMNEDTNLLYSHFLNAGMIAARIGKEHNIKAYCAFGESTLWSIKYKNEKRAKKVLKSLNGFISVSSENSNQLIEVGIGTDSNIRTFPNGVNLSQFIKKDKLECRKKLNLPMDPVIGIFVGHFIERKGVKRVEKAAHGIENLMMMYIGSGELEPSDNNIAFKGQVDHAKLHMYLSAADFFILPTQAEGCCNAIIEAMACGLPIISSDGSFNDDILDDSNSIRVNPNDISEIRTAILKITSDVKARNILAENSERKAKNFDIVQRAYNILKFMDIDIEEDVNG